MQALSTTDAFFVAYQERAGITMHLGAEVALDGELDEQQLRAAIDRALARWPQLASTIAKRAGGLAWRDERRDVLTIGGDVAAWRNQPIDPFVEPPFGVLWTSGTLAFRCHHAVADGVLFLAIVGEIASGLAGGEAPTNGAGTHPFAFRRLRRETSIAASWRYMRALSREARADRSARVALRAVEPGDLATCDRRIAPIAARGELRPPWLACAAWLRAVHAWNERRGVASSLLSVEVPVSMRRGPHAMSGVGNHLTVLTLFGDARVTRDELARALWDAYVDGIRRRDHLAVPLLGAPLRVLPWPILRRAIVNTTSTGFATTHFTWIDQANDFRAALRERSGGAFAVRDQRFYTPVCLRMGVALGVLAWPDELQLSITYRTTGLSADDVDELADLLVTEL